MNPENDGLTLRISCVMTAEHMWVMHRMVAQVLTYGNRAKIKPCGDNYRGEDVFAVYRDPREVKYWEYDGRGYGVDDFV